MARKNVLKIERDGLSVDADVRTEKLDQQAIDSRPEIVRRDRETGQVVTREQYDKATGESLDEGYGHRWVTPDGREVPAADVRYYEVVGDGEREVSRYEPTLGRERVLEPITWVPVGTLGEYLVTRTYELWAEDDEDVEQLYDLAQYISSHGLAPVVPIVLQASLVQSWGIVTPQFYDDTFSLLVRVTRRRVAPEHHMFRPDRAEPDEEPPRPTQEFPFQ